MPVASISHRIAEPIEALPEYDAACTPMLASGVADLCAPAAQATTQIEAHLPPAATPVLMPCASAYFAHAKRRPRRPAS